MQFHAIEIQQGSFTDSAGGPVGAQRLAEHWEACDAACKQETA